MSLNGLLGSGVSAGNMTITRFVATFKHGFLTGGVPVSGTAVGRIDVFRLDTMSPVDES